METDEMELDTIGDRKTALFIIISDTDDTFNFVVSILYTQLFNLLCDKADDEYGGRIPVHVRCLLDEFSNIGQIPKFAKLIATIRSREISASIILQSQSQLKAIYKDNADTIVGNCDTNLFLGGKEKTTLKEISEILGKETIDSFNTSETRGRELSHGLNYQKLGKDILYYFVNSSVAHKNTGTGTRSTGLWLGLIIAVLRTGAGAHSLRAKPSAHELRRSYAIGQQACRCRIHDSLKGGKCEPPAAQVPIRCGQSPPLMSYVAHMPSASKLADVAFTTALRGESVNPLLRRCPFAAGKALRS